ncbi:MAG: hypothetical protein COA97_07400 [Flavobacteriales bacterium]|nr:MAG: hypothetical protein COA97_07400 [Flavobacteriales bacterium]
MISIIIPVYNAEKYISETINSVFSQTYRNWELIIIDDGSADNSANIIKQFCKDNDKVRYYYQENSGVSVARNNGMNKAKGKYIALLDADDVWEKDNLRLKNDVLETKNDVSWVFSNMYNANETAEIVSEASKGTDKNILESILLWKREVIPGPCSNIIFKKKCFEDGISFDKELSTAADQYFTIQLASRYKGHHINEPLWRYRILSNSMSKNISVMEKDHIRVYNKAANKKLFKNFWFKQQCFSNLYWILAGSWWKDGNNKLRGMRFIILALINNPISIIRLIK